MYDLDSLLCKFNAAFSFSFHHYRNGKLLKSYSEHDFYIDISQAYLKSYLDQAYPVCFIVSPEYILSGYIALSEKEEYLIVGPSCPYEITYRQAEKVLHEVDLPSSQTTHVVRYFYFLQRMSTRSFQNMLSFLYVILFPGKQTEPIRLSYKAQRINLQNSPSEFFINENISSIMEDTLMSLVAAGKVNEAEQALDSIFSSFDLVLPNHAQSAIRALKNTLIAATSTVAHKAIEGGMDYRTAATLSDYYIYKIESLSAVSDLNEILRTMILDYTRRVSFLISPDATSPIINAIYRDVWEHRYDKVTLETISKRLHFSKSYVTHLFKRETGLTLTEFIHQQKIKEAQFLLDTTSLTLADISDKLAFSSQQQFHLIFKDVTGMTPKQYKNRDKYLKPS